MQFSDFRSDTLTKPSKAMREAMAQSEVGDDVFREDPTVNALEERIAQMFQKEGMSLINKYHLYFNYI